MKFILSILMTFAGKIIAAFGISLITYTGFNALQNKLLSYLTSSLNSIPTDALQIFYLAGGGIFLNYLFGAFAFVIALKSLGFMSIALKSK